MKPKHQRVHYARKQLHKTDPERYCRFNRYVHLHEPSGPIDGLLDVARRSGKYTSRCLHCESRIEALLVERSMASWSQMTWRAELYVIEELPW